MEAQAMRARMAKVSTLITAHAEGAHEEFALGRQDQVGAQILAREEACLHKIQEHVRLVGDPPVQAIGQTRSLLKQVLIGRIGKLRNRRSWRHDRSGPSLVDHVRNWFLPLKMERLEVRASSIAHGGWIALNRLHRVHDQTVEADPQLLAGEDGVDERTEMLRAVLA